MKNFFALLLTLMISLTVLSCGEKDVTVILVKKKLG